MDDAFHGRGRLGHGVADAFGVREAEDFLVAGEIVELGGDLLELALEGRECVSRLLVDRGLDDPVRADRGVVAGFKTADRFLARREAKSRVRTRIWISAPRNSRLVSARSDARSAVRNALSTSRSPAVKAMPLTRNPATGMAASRMMRV